MSIEALKAAYEAATPGEWRPLRWYDRAGMSKEDALDVGEPEPPIIAIGTDTAGVASAHDLFRFKEANANFIALAHNMMPDLLEAVESLKELATLTSAYRGDRLPIRDPYVVRTFERASVVLHKLILPKSEVQS